MFGVRVFFVKPGSLPAGFQLQPFAGGVFGTPPNRAPPGTPGAVVAGLGLLVIVVSYFVGTTSLDRRSGRF